MIVDDEPRHRRGMAGMLLASRPGCEVFTAGDGAKALEMAGIDRPDVIFTDIRMPQMDGLTFLRRLKEALPYKPRVVMLSAYNLFEYAQEALRQGAFDYLLKPVDVDKLEEVLVRLESIHREEREARVQTKVLEEQMTAASLAHQGRLMQQWLSGSLSGEEERSWLSTGNADGQGLVIVSELEPASGKGSDFATKYPQREMLSELRTSLPDTYIEPRSTSLQADRLHRALERAWSTFGTAFTVAWDVADWTRPRWVTILQAGASLGERREEIRRVVTSLQTEPAGGGSPGRWVHAIGDECVDLTEGGPQSYRTALAALSYLFYDQHGAVLFHDELLPVRPVLTCSAAELLDLLHTSDEDAAKELCRKAVTAMSADGMADPQTVKDQTCLLLLKLADSKPGLGLNEVVEEAVQHIRSCRRFSEMLTILEAALGRIGSTLKEQKKSKRELVIDSCLDLMRERYMDDLSLESVAESFRFNPSYFSTLFKEATGRSFSDVLIEIRIRKAEELLRDGSRLKVYEIAERCGFRDTKYFSRSFKKHVGATPEAYRHWARQQKSGEGSSR
ncbi:response regulator [Paenibacillus sp. XY044]|uniref:response regulator n=1 Tax=Paenibacillus sp. XY044 TaxID=2026089 RepID=UPI00211B139E|nr:response regulator [Paenibacillus sp. XY044]